MSRDPLATWATTPGGRKVLAEARRRIERGSQLTAGTLRLELTQTERHDIGGLLGVGWEASDREVSVRALNSAFETRGTTLRALLETEAPLRDLRAEKAAARSAASAENARAIERLVAAGVDQEVAGWAGSRRGMPRAGTGDLLELVEAAALVWSKLPGAEGAPVLLAQLAGELFDSTHALDRTTQLGRTVARLAAASNVEPDTSVSVDVTSAARWRAAWTSVGVACDEVSSLVLILNVRLEGDAPATQLTGAVGDPIWLSLRSMRGAWKPAFRAVWICENPSIIEAAADCLGERCPPLVCTFGQPSLAALELIRGLAAAGVTMRIRADDDGAGQSIVAQMRTVAPNAELWRYEIRPSRTANESPVYEEQLLPTLLEDLRSA